MQSCHNKIVSDIKQACASYGIRFYEGQGRSVFLDGTHSSGYFDDESKVLAYAKKAQDSILILLHESSHLDQWIEGKYSFSKYPMMWEWLSGKEYTDKQIKSVIQDVIAVELDCEKRTVRKIKQYGLDVDVERYIQKANAYMYFFHWIMISRRWMKRSNSFYSKDDLIDACPKKFLSSYKECPLHILRLFAKHNI